MVMESAAINGITWKKHSRIHIGSKFSGGNMKTK
jgi:hypothetical protein